MTRLYTLSGPGPFPTLLAIYLGSCARIDLWDRGTVDPAPQPEPVSVPQAWAPLPAEGDLLVDWGVEGGSDCAPERLAEDLDGDGRLDDVERASCGGSGWWETRTCTRLAHDGALVCEEVESTRYSRFYGRRVFAVLPSANPGDVAAVRGQLQCEPADRGNPHQGAMWRLAEKGPSNGDDGVVLFSPANLRWFPGRPVVQSCAILTTQEAAGLAGAWTWTGEGSPVDDAAGWVVIHGGGQGPLPMAGPETSDTPTAVLTLPAHTIYQARHAIVVWHEPSNQHAWLESFDRDAGGQGFKVDRWEVIAGIRPDGTDAVLVDLASPSRTLRIVMPTP